MRRPALPVALGLCAATLVFASLGAQAGAKPQKPTAHSTNPLLSAAAQSSTGKSSASKDDADSIRVPTINDAPKSDFERVAWCHGILSGDMQLADIIDPLEPKDPQIQMIGLSYLRAYEAALTLSGQGKTAAGHALAEKARQHGLDAWAQARKAEIHKAAWAYDNWQLPGDCEHAAVRLSGHPDLFHEMATDDENKAITTVLNSGGPHPYEEGPAPTLKAQNVDPGAGEVVANNKLAVQAKASASSAATSSDASSSAASNYSQDLGQKLGWDKKSN